MKKQYQIDKQRAVQQFRQLATEENPNIQMILPLAEIVGLLQDGVGHLLREAGLSLMSLVMEEECVTWPGNGMNSMPPAWLTAGARKTATASWTAQRYPSKGRG